MGQPQRTVAQIMEICEAAVLWRASSHIRHSRNIDYMRQETLLQRKIHKHKIPSSRKDVINNTSPQTNGAVQTVQDKLQKNLVKRLKKKKDKYVVGYSGDTEDGRVGAPPVRAIELLTR